MAQGLIDEVSPSVYYYSLKRERSAPLPSYRPGLADWVDAVACLLAQDIPEDAEVVAVRQWDGTHWLCAHWWESVRVGAATEDAIDWDRAPEELWADAIIDYGGGPDV